MCNFFKKKEKEQPHPFNSVLIKLGFTEDERCKFKPILRYFKNIELEDLFEIDDDDYETVPENDDILLFWIFIKELKPKLQKLYNKNREEMKIKNKIARFLT
jgi:hypothetical protein